MEEKKLDVNTIIGFVLIFGIIIWMLYTQKPAPNDLKGKKRQQEQFDGKIANSEQTNKQNQENVKPTDSAALAQYKNSLGAFAYSATLPSATGGYTELENSKLYLKISNKGGQIVEAKLKEYNTYDSVPVYLIKDGNSAMGIDFTTTDNRTLNTKDLYFTPEKSANGEDQVLSMRLKKSETEYLEYRYELKNNDYLVNFTVRSQGLNGVINNSADVKMGWRLKGMRHSKSVTYENRYTRLTYNHEDNEVDKLSPSGNDEETRNNVKWMSFRQHFFSSILVTDTPFKTAKLSSYNLAKEEGDSIKYTKLYAATMPLALNGGELNYKMHMYYGPTDYDVLKHYKDLDIADSMPTGWGIFGVINRWVIMPLFKFLMGFLPAGFAIIALTIIVKLVLSPVQYKQFVSQAKMKVLKPEMEELNAKYGDNPMKKQQETMALYRKAGVNPMSGCLPAVLQMPVFYALFTFFPTAFVLRQKSFLWAEDLSSFDSIVQLPFTIPIYGNHISLFPILASVAIFIYMQMTSAQSMQQTQPGMPNMKFILYLSPLMMLVFFNQYASGLSLYYFVSNTITIFIMLAIKKFIVDEDKIHAKIQENKQKPKKESKFQQKLKQMMEQAEAQQKTGKKIK